MRSFRLATLPLAIAAAPFARTPRAARSNRHPAARPPFHPAGGHIPYRDSKLTRILQPSLGGNAKTAIIAAMTGAGVHVEESHSTLRFATRAKSVVNNAVVNEVLSDAAVLKRQAKEIEVLRKKLEAAGCAPRSRACPPACLPACSHLAAAPPPVPA